MLAGNCTELASEPPLSARAGHGRGICMEFLPISKLREGTFLGQTGRGVLRGSCLLGESALPSRPEACPQRPWPGLPSAPGPDFPLAPDFLSGVWKGSKDSQP